MKSKLLSKLCCYLVEGVKDPILKFLTKNKSKVPEGFTEDQLLSIYKSKMFFKNIRTVLEIMCKQKLIVKLNNKYRLP